MLSFLLLSFLNASSNYLELGGSIGYGALWDKRGVDANIGITYIRSLKNCPIKIDCGVYGGTMKKICADWDDPKRYGVDFNVFCGIVFFPVTRKFSIRTNLVWNPYIKEMGGPNHLFDNIDHNCDDSTLSVVVVDYDNSTLLAIIGADINCVYRFDNGVYMGCSYAFRKNLARDSFGGFKNSWQDYAWDNDLCNLNMIKLMAGYSWEFGEEENSVTRRRGRRKLMVR